MNEQPQIPQNPYSPSAPIPSQPAPQAEPIPPPIKESNKFFLIVIIGLIFAVVIGAVYLFSLTRKTTTPPTSPQPTASVEVPTYNEPTSAAQEVIPTPASSDEQEVEAIEVDNVDINLQEVEKDLQEL